MISRIKRWWIRRKVRSAIALLRYLDDIMTIKAYPRTYRRSFWRDFVSSIELRKDVVNYLVSELLNEEPKTGEKIVKRA